MLDDFEDICSFTALDQLKAECQSIMTAEELLNMELPTIKWVIPNLIPAGLSLLAGPPKIGKSYLLLKLAKDITDAGGTVFYFAGEDSLALLQSRMKQLGIEGNDRLCLVCGRDGQLAKPNEYLHKVRQLMLAREFDAVFLDNMELVLPDRAKQSDDYAYFYKHLPEWAALAAQENTAIVMTHHTTKETREDPFKSILGSQAIMGCCDSVFVLERGSQANQFSLHVTGKFSVDAVHNLKKDGPVFEFDGTAKEAELKSKKGLNRIYEMIAENPNINQSEIIKALNLPKGNVSRDISKLIKLGFIGGNPSEGYTALSTTDNLDNPDN